MISTTERKTYSLRKGDQVQVIAGREKGKIGKVLGVSRKDGRVLVEKVNLVKRHMKPSQQNPAGGAIEKEASLHYSNVLLMCSKCNKGVRHGVKVVEKGAKGAAGEMKKVRICKKCGESLETA